MHITVIAAGSRGDVQPYVALAVAIQQTGYDVTMVAPANFGGLVAQHHLHFMPMSVDIQQLYESEYGLALVGSETNPIKIFRSVRNMMRPILKTVWQDLKLATQNTDAIVAHTVLAVFIQALAEKHDIPFFSAANMPLMLTGAHPMSVLDVPSLGHWGNRFSHRVTFRLFWAILGDLVNELRDDLGLPQRGYDLMRYVLTDVPMLGGFSSEIYPKPNDWPAHHYVTGFWFLDEPAWEPPNDLVQFLDAGEPPVYIGFGSMASREPQSTMEMSVNALVQSGQRGLILTGWGGMQQIHVPDSIYVLDAAPHHWLFPKMKAVVHHGGAGTTAAGLYAGKPTVIIPFFADQPFWGKQVNKMQLGSAPILRKHLTVEGLNVAIRTVCETPHIQNNAQAIGQKIRAEDGAMNAVRTMQQIMEK